MDGPAPTPPLKPTLSPQGVPATPKSQSAEPDYNLKEINAIFQHIIFPALHGGNQLIPSHIHNDFDTRPRFRQGIGEIEKVQWAFQPQTNQTPLEQTVNAMHLFEELRLLFGRELFNTLVYTCGLDLNNIPYIVFYATPLIACSAKLAKLNDRVRAESPEDKLNRGHRLRAMFDRYEQIDTATKEAKVNLQKEIAASGEEFEPALINELITLRGIFAGFIKRVEIDWRFQEEAEFDWVPGKFQEAFFNQEPSVIMECFREHINWHLTHQAQIEDIYTCADPGGADKKQAKHLAMCDSIGDLGDATKAVNFAHMWGRQGRGPYLEAARDFINYLKFKHSHFGGEIKYEILSMFFDRQALAAGQPARARGYVKFIAIKFDKCLFGDNDQAFKAFFDQIRIAFPTLVKDVTEFRGITSQDGHYYLVLDHEVLLKVYNDKALWPTLCSADVDMLRTMSNEVENQRWSANDDENAPTKKVFHAARAQTINNLICMMEVFVKTEVEAGRKVALTSGDVLNTEDEKNGFTDSLQKSEKHKANIQNVFVDVIKVGELKNACNLLCSEPSKIGSLKPEIRIWYQNLKKIVGACYVAFCKEQGIEPKASPLDIFG